MYLPIFLIPKFVEISKLDRQFMYSENYLIKLVNVENLIPFTYQYLSQQIIN